MFSLCCYFGRGGCGVGSSWHRINLIYCKSWYGLKLNLIERVWSSLMRYIDISRNFFIQSNSIYFAKNFGTLARLWNAQMQENIWKLDWYPVMKYTYTIKCSMVTLLTLLSVQCQPLFFCVVSFWFRIRIAAIDQCVTSISWQTNF